MGGALVERHFAGQSSIQSSTCRMQQRPSSSRDPDFTLRSGGSFGAKGRKLVVIAAL
jgi:hypothetical protein